MDADLPGADLVEQGLADLAERRVTVESLLVSIAASRLRALGCAVEQPLRHPEHDLYALLARSEPESAHSRYLALVRRLDSYTRAAECVAR